MKNWIPLSRVGHMRLNCDFSGPTNLPLTVRDLFCFGIGNQWFFIIFSRLYISWSTHLTLLLTLLVELKKVIQYENMVEDYNIGYGTIQITIYWWNKILMFFCNKEVRLSTKNVAANPHPQWQRWISVDI